MSSNQQPLKTNATDLRDVLEFWEMKDEVLDLLWGLANRGMGFSKFNSDYLADMAEKIESLGKKEKE